MAVSLTPVGKQADGGDVSQAQVSPSSPFHHSHSQGSPINCDGSMEDIWEATVSGLGLMQRDRPPQGDQGIRKWGMREDPQLLGRSGGRPAKSPTTCGGNPQ